MFIYLFARFRITNPFGLTHSMRRHCLLSTASRNHLSRHPFAHCVSSLLSFTLPSLSLSLVSSFRWRLSFVQCVTAAVAVDSSFVKCIVSVTIRPLSFSVSLSLSIYLSLSLTLPLPSFSMLCLPTLPAVLRFSALLSAFFFVPLQSHLFLAFIFLCTYCHKMQLQIQLQI